VVDTVVDQVADMLVVEPEVLVVADLMPLAEQALQDKEIPVETEITLALVIIMLAVVEALVLLVQMVLVIILQPLLVVMVVLVPFLQ
jgi:hypothetical protein